MNPLTGKAKGVIQDSRTFTKHSRADKEAAFEAAEENTQAILDAQIEEITTFLSTSVLADQVSGPTQTPGGSLWSRNSPHRDGSISGSPSQEGLSPSHLYPVPQTLDLKANPKPTAPRHFPRQAESKHTREDEVLKCLSLLEEDTKSLLDETLRCLASLGQPSPSGPPTAFPLSELFHQLSNLKTRLQTVTIKSPAVLAFKDTITRNTQLIESKLMRAKRDWKEIQLDIKATKTPGYGIPYETGTTFCYVQFTLLLILQF